MSTIELEPQTALRKANVPEEDARKVANAMNRGIDQRYNIHAAQLVTKGDFQAGMAESRKDLAEAKAEIIKWCVASIFGAVALFAAIVKIL